MFQLKQSSDTGALIALKVNMPGKADLDPNKQLEVQSACMFVGLLPFNWPKMAQQKEDVADLTGSTMMTHADDRTVLRLSDVMEAAMQRWTSARRHLDLEHDDLGVSMVDVVYIFLTGAPYSFRLSSCSHVRRRRDAALVRSEPAEAKRFCSHWVRSWLNWSGKDSRRSCSPSVNNLFASSRYIQSAIVNGAFKEKMKHSIMTQDVGFVTNTQLLLKETYTAISHATVLQQTGTTQNKGKFTTLQTPMTVKSL
ncbi:MAG: hypothetical protein FRX49_07217 [Trebouxia sp. A1-2]|nr:MAG: hypothetical protein FRX49_07217 [Trebouxia sp. A1-2]